MRTTILIIIIISTKILCGQDTLYDSKVCIKIAPLAILDIYGGMSPRIGVEYKLKRNFALYNEIGTYIPNANGMSNNTGGLVKVEFKTYLNKSQLTTDTYVSAELFFKHQSYGTYDSIISTDKYIKDYNVSKNVGCFTIKFGILNVSKFKFVADAFVGLGVRYKVTQSSLTSIENENIKAEGDYSTNVRKNQAGTFTYLNFDAGVKIGFKVK